MLRAIRNYLGGTLVYLGFRISGMSHDEAMEMFEIMLDGVVRETRMVMSGLDEADRAKINATINKRLMEVFRRQTRV